MPPESRNFVFDMCLFLEKKHVFVLFPYRLETKMQGVLVVCFLLCIGAVYSEPLGPGIRLTLPPGVPRALPPGLNLQEAVDSKYPNSYYPDGK